MGEESKSSIHYSARWVEALEALKHMSTRILYGEWADSYVLALG